MSWSALLLSLCLSATPAVDPASSKHPATAHDGITVAGAEMPQPPPGTAVMAAYVQLSAEAGDQLIGVSGELSADIQMHQMRHVDGRMEMRQIPAIDLPAGTPVKLERGGLHLMILNPVRRPEIGEIVHLTLHFRDAGGLSVPFQVVDGRATNGTNADPHAHHHHH